MRTISINRTGCRLSFAISLLGVLSFANGAAATIVTLSGQSFDELSGPELLNPAFNVAGGQTTVKSYSGLIEVLVSGSGLNNVNLPNNRTDAFYQFDGPTNTVNANTPLAPNTLRLGSQTQIASIPSNFPFVPNSSLRAEAGSVHVASLAIVYDVASFSVPNSFTLDSFNALAPVYSPSHSYHFVMNLGSYSGTLTLGYGDGGVFDNSSDTYHISLWQVAAVPEPSSCVLLIVGFLFALAYLAVGHFLSEKPAHVKVRLTLDHHPKR